MIGSKLFAMLCIIQTILAIFAVYSWDEKINQAIERGYALYCPGDGRFAWKGECDG